MNRRWIPAALLVALAPLACAEDKGEQQQRSGGQAQNGGQTHLLNTEDLIGAKVKDSKGEKLGEIKQLILDPESATVEFAILSVGGALRGQSTAVPWSELKPGKEKEFTTSIPKQNLENAPSFEKDKWMSFSRGDWKKMIGLYVPGYAEKATAGPGGQPGQEEQDYMTIEQREAQRRAAELPAVAEGPDERSGQQQGVAGGATPGTNAAASPSLFGAPSPSPAATMSPGGSPSPSPTMSPAPSPTPTISPIVSPAPSPGTRM